MSDFTSDGYDDLTSLLADDIPLDPDEAAGRTSELGTGHAAGVPSQPEDGPDEPGAVGDDPEDTDDEPSPATPVQATETRVAMEAAPAPETPGRAEAPSPLERYVDALGEEVEGADDEGAEVYVDPGTLLALAQACLAEARSEREQRQRGDELVRRDLAGTLRSASPVVTVNPQITISSVDAGDATLNVDRLTLPPAAAAAIASKPAAPAGAAVAPAPATDSLLEPAPGEEARPKPEDKGEPTAPAGRKGIPATVVGIAIGLALLAVLFLVLQLVSGGVVGAPIVL